MTCLLLLALLVLQATSGSSEVPEIARAHAAPTGEASDPEFDRAFTPEVGPSAPLTEDHRRTLEAGSQEPVVGELAVVLTTVAELYEPEGAAVAPAIRPYLARLAGRLNSRGERYHARIYAADPALAERRAAELRHAFDSVGLIPDLLTLTGAPGRPGVDVERY